MDSPSFIPFLEGSTQPFLIEVLRHPVIHLYLGLGFSFCKT